MTHNDEASLGLNVLELPVISLENKKLRSIMAFIGDVKGGIEVGENMG